MKFGRINYHAIREHLSCESLLTLKECKERIQIGLSSRYTDEFNISFYPRSKSEYIQSVQSKVTKKPYKVENKTFYIKRISCDPEYKNTEKMVSIPSNDYHIRSAHMNQNDNHKIPKDKSNIFEIIDVFINWLIIKKNYTQKTAEQCVSLINEASEYVSTINKTSSHFFAITASTEAANVKKKLFSDHSFKELNKKHKNRYYESIDQYISFLNKNPELVNTVSVVMPINKDIPLYTEVLSDKKFKPLVDALNKDNIATLEQMQKINIYTYLNKNELYMWEERLQIAEELNRILETKQRNEGKSRSLTIDRKSDKGNMEANNVLVAVDSDSDNKYKYTKPCKLELRGKQRTTRSWKAVHVQLCELLIFFTPNLIKTLVDRPLTENSKRKHLSLTKTEMFYPKKLSNGMWVETNYSAADTVRICNLLCEKCGISSENLKIYCRKKDHTGVCVGKNQKADDKTVESFIRKSGVEPNSINVIQKVVPGITRGALSRILNSNPQIVEISKGSYIHRSNIVDLEEAAETMLQIIMSQFKQFDGYTNIRLLYYAIRNDLSLFLNDNDLDKMENVYYLAKHLFSKERYKSAQFVFYGNIHIWVREPNYPKSLKGLLINYARNSENVITLEECEAFMYKTGNSQKNIHNILQITKEPTFLQYKKECYLLSEKIPIDDSWKNQAKCCLEELFEITEYVIPHDICSSWFNKLPALPFNLKWTYLLLQEVIAFYPDIGFRTIPSSLHGQALHTLHAAIVRKDSQFQSFADIVYTYVSENMKLPQRMSSEELRLILCDAGMIHGNNLSLNLHKALDDYRFAWSDGNKRVYIHEGC